jgi:hypothetical protein
VDSACTPVGRGGAAGSLPLPCFRCSAWVANILGDRLAARALARIVVRRESSSGYRRSAAKGPGKPRALSSGYERDRAWPNPFQRVHASVPNGYSPRVPDRSSGIGRGSVGRLLLTRGFSLPLGLTLVTEASSSSSIRYRPFIEHDL